MRDFVTTALCQIHVTTKERLSSECIDTIGHFQSPIPELEYYSEDSTDLTAMICVGFSFVVDLIGR